MFRQAITAIAFAAITFAIPSQAHAGGWKEEVDALRARVEVLEESLSDTDVLVARVEALESRRRLVLVDSTGQEVGPYDGRVAVEAEGFVLRITAQITTEMDVDVYSNTASTSHLLPDCTDAPMWLNDAVDPLEHSSALFWWMLAKSGDVLFIDSEVSPVLVWDPAQMSGPVVYTDDDSGCVENQQIKFSSNINLTWYLLPLRSVLNLKETYPPPLHIELR